ncbi:hypothetical protein AOLI_G00085790 [Acnodon oligacanthus]
MGILGDYLQKWHLRLSVGKTVAVAYHLNNREARRELDVYVGKNLLEFLQAPKYLGVHLDQTLSYKQHLDEVKAKPNTWSRSSHVNKVDTAINSTLRIVTGCLKPTPASYLPVLAGIAPASLRREATTLTLARNAQKHDWHILHKATITSAPPGRLKSRHPYNKAAQEVPQPIPEDLSRDAWLAATWKQMLDAGWSSRLPQYIRDPGGGVKGEDLPRHLWTLLNRLRTGVGRFKSVITEEVGPVGQCSIRVWRT